MQSDNLTRFARRILVCTAVAVAALRGANAVATTVVVSPANMDGWTLNTFDYNGDIVTGTAGPYDGTAAMVTGPATPPLGVGSAELATPVGYGDGAAAIATESYDGTLLSSITALSYSAYDAVNNGQQFPYLAISVDTDPGNSDNAVDTLFFEPPYQENEPPNNVTGDPSLPDQGPTYQNEWQSWNAFEGGFWDNNDVLGTGGENEVQPLSAFIAQFPNATIENGGFAGLGGIALQVGFSSSGETEQGYVDDFTITTTDAGSTTYDFDPSPVPLPPTAWTFLTLIAGVAAFHGIRRFRGSAAMV